MMKALSLQPPPQAVWNAPGVVGKSVEEVKPSSVLTYQILSTAMPFPLSLPLPPKYVE